VKEKANGNPGAYNEAGALGLFQVLLAGQGDGAFKKEIYLKDPELNNIATKVQLWKIYNSEAESVDDVLKEKKNFKKFEKEELNRIDKRFWIPWNQVSVTSEIFWGRKFGDAQEITLREKTQSKKLWSAWGDMALYRKQTGGTNSTRLGVLTKVNPKTVRKAVGFLNPFQESNPWSNYVRWAVGNGQYDGALVDEDSNNSRPADASEEPKDSTKPERMPYRNRYDVLAWCFADEVQKKLEAVSDPNAAAWNKGVVEHGVPRHFYFNQDYFNDGGSFWYNLTATSPNPT
jgi:hypothetical protein